MEKDKFWQQYISAKMKEEYMVKLRAFIKQRMDAGATIYPPIEQTFNAFHACPWKKLRVVILGQDPYHGKEQSHGLAFSTLDKKCPPSLENIMKEIWSDLTLSMKELHGDKYKMPCRPFDMFPSLNLLSWSEQGVLLLNTILSVEEAKPLSHINKGWERFTSETIEFISTEKESIVFMLWGNNAKALKKHINQSKNHLILEAAHPSPLSANKGGWFGCRHFTKCNNFLRQNNKHLPGIVWGTWDYKTYNQ